MALAAAPSLADAKTDNAIEQYASARLAEIGNRDDVALKTYLKLYRQAPDSDVLIDRLFDSAIRRGDMTTAVRAARARELRDGGGAETALLLFADSYRSKNWNMAALAADEVAQSGSFGFMSPILKSWTEVAQGKSPELSDTSSGDDPFLVYYSGDQRIYLDLASGRLSSAKIDLRALASQQGDHVRDVMITAAGVISAAGDEAFAEALMRSATGGDNYKVASGGTRLSPAIGVAALYSRIAAALIEQNVTQQGLLMARIAHWVAPEQHAAQVNLARALNANGLPENAVALLDAIPPSSPYWNDALTTKIDWLLQNGDMRQAEAAAAEAVKRSSNSVAAKLLTARVFQQIGKSDQAVSIYRSLADAAETAKLTPRQQVGYRLLLVSALDDTGQWPAAKSELEETLLLEPNNPQAMNYLGYSLLERNTDTARATELIKRAYRADPNSAAITDSLGWAYYLEGDTAQAVPLLEKAVKASGNDPVMNEHLGDAYWSAGRKRDARYAWQVAAQATDDDAKARLARKIDMGLTGNANAP